VRGSLPKSNGQRSGHATLLEWTDLPPEPQLEAPLLPKWRKWHPETRQWWRTIWRLPQATQWDPGGASLFVLATLVDDVVTGAAAPGRVSAEIRAREEAHGLGGPKSLLALRWKVPATPPDNGDADLAALMARAKRLAS
jgi:hypothetical protein